MTLDFRYEAVNRSGQTIRGALSAASERELLQKLHQQDLTPVDVVSVAETRRGARRDAGAAPTPQALVLVIQELATLLGAGVPLAEAVDSTGQAHRESAIGAAFDRVHTRLRSGAPFSEALRAAGLALPDYLFHLVSAGELTGKLAEALRGATEQMEYDERTRQDFRNALVYPAVLVVSGIAATLLIFVVVVPKFSNMLKSSRAQIPEMSRWVLEAGLFAKENLLWLGLAIGALVAAALMAWANAATRQAALDTGARLPLLGEWLRNAEIGRWAKMLGTLLANKVPVVRALELSQAGVRITAIGHGLRLVQRDLRAGQKLADALATHQIVNAMGINLVRVGERSGELAPMLQTLGRVYDNASRDRMKRFLVLLEPATILIVGAVIAFIMIAIMLAITSMSTMAA